MQYATALFKEEKLDTEKVINVYQQLSEILIKNAVRI